MFFVGGFQVVKVGWLTPHAVFCDLIVADEDGWLYQVYANRKLVGCTRSVVERRVVGQLVASDSASPLTVVRVDPASALIDYGQEIPSQPWNRFTINWTTAGSSGIHHFDVVCGTVAGGAVDLTNVIARVPFTVDGDYSFDLPPLDDAGTWHYGIVPRDNADDGGNAGTTIAASVLVVLPPDDVTASEATGDRFTVSAVTNTVTVAFAW